MGPAFTNSEKYYYSYFCNDYQTRIDCFLKKKIEIIGDVTIKSLEFLWISLAEAVGILCNLQPFNPFYNGNL